MYFGGSLFDRSKFNVRGQYYFNGCFRIPSGNYRLESKTHNYASMTHSQFLDSY